MKSIGIRIDHPPHPPCDEKCGRKAAFFVHAIIAGNRHTRLCAECLETFGQEIEGKLLTREGRGRGRDE